MSKLFVIEDTVHAEICGEYSTFNEALDELKKRMEIPWDREPNVCSCISWKECGREYEIIEYETNSVPWKKINTTPVLNISAKEVTWLLKDNV